MVKTKYYFLSAVLIVLGAVMAFMPETPAKKEVQPDQLLAEINYENRFWSTDRVASTLIQGDPLLLLVDVRTAEEYAAFHLPGAMNIPLQDLLKPDWQGFFQQDTRDIVLYSNGTIYANQSWMLLRRQNARNLYVMRGGLNRWVETIMQAPVPKRTAPESEHKQYAFRKAASLFFGRGGVDAPAETQQVAPVIMPERKKKKAVQGGC